jgi:hypothetical protein
MNPFRPIVAAALLLPGLVSAVDITNISGQWDSTTDGKNITGVGTSQINWGGTKQSISERSGYLFSPSPNLFDIDPDVPFVLGTFTHMNKVIPQGTPITQATLGVTFLLNNSNIISLDYIFNHNETLNQAGSCPAGSVSVCDDIVTAAKNPTTTETFAIGDVLYTLTIKGFQVGGETFTNFLTREQFNNTAQLIGELTRVAVPEPGTYLLIGSLLCLLLCAKGLTNAKQQKE